VTRSLRLFIVSLLAIAGTWILVGPALAHSEHEGTEAHEQVPFNDLTNDQPMVVDVVELSGLIDPVMVNMMADTLANVDPTKVLAVIFQVNSTGSVVSNADLYELVVRISEAKVPISFWVGPSGSRATGPMAQLAGLADDVGIAPGARLGALGPSILPEGWAETPFGLPLNTDLVTDTVGYDEAAERGIARQSPVLLAQLVGIDGFEVITDETVSPPTLEPVTHTRFHKLDVVSEFFHTVASPAVAYLLLLIGMGLLVFELFTAGVGVAGVLGAGCFLLSTYGLGVLPTRWWGLALLVVAFLGYAIDIQTGVPRAWTVIGTIALVLGSLFLFDGTPISWITLLFGIVGTAVAMSAGMPAMVRTRFSTPTIGREWMIGEMGEAVEALGPNGTVTVRDAVWRARTNRATPIPVGAPIRVIGIEGLWLEVEPEEGGARDHRERSKNTQ